VGSRFDYKKNKQFVRYSRRESKIARRSERVQGAINMRERLARRKASAEESWLVPELLLAACGPIHYFFPIVLGWAHGRPTAIKEQARASPTPVVDQRSRD
jgi:hypothetical protein